MEARENLFQHFYGLGDADQQNAFLRQHMDVRARLNISDNTTSGRSPRRITCKYLVPLLPSSETADVCQKAFVSAFVITTKRVRLQREKLICSMGLNSYSSHNKPKLTFPIIKDDNMDSFANGINGLKVYSNAKKTIFSFENSENGQGTLQVTIPKELDSQSSSSDDMSTVRKSIKRKLTDDPLIPLGLVMPEGVTITAVTATPDHDRDIAIVNNFFSNQLWKPEYIGTYS